jgi:hypothetical protein
MNTCHPSSRSKIEHVSRFEVEQVGEEIWLFGRLVGLPYGGSGRLAFTGTLGRHRFEGRTVPDGIETGTIEGTPSTVNPKDFVLVAVPEMQFVMIEGKDGPEGEQYNHAMRWLFSPIYPIKRIARDRLGKDFVEPPLEALWWTDDMDDFIAGNKDKLKWRLMIVRAD